MSDATHTLSGDSLHDGIRHGPWNRVCKLRKISHGLVLSV